jgi:2'-5' RNA ligase
MNYAIELYFDEESSRRIDTIRYLLESNNVTVDVGTLPHISLAIFTNVDGNGLIEEITSFSKRELNLHLEFSSIGIFPISESVIFLAPKVTQQLLVFHRDFLQFMSKYSTDLNVYYNDDLWVPHCTLGIHMSDDELINAIRLLKNNNYLPISVTIKKIGILTFPPNKQVFVTNFLKA